MLNSCETTADIRPSDRTLLVLRLLGAGLSKAAIARQLGCCWDTVAKAAIGEREAVADGITHFFHGDESFLAAAVRCPTCHGLIHVTPCRLCQGRAKR